MIAFYATSFIMQIILKLKNIENKTEPTKDFELFTGPRLKGASLQHKY